MAKKKHVRIVTFGELCGKLAPQTAKIVEIADHAAGENTTVHTRSATLKFPSTSGSHKASFDTQGNGYLGTFKLGKFNEAHDTLKWTFKLPDSRIDFLQAGQKLVQKYNVSARDSSGTISTALVTITIVGTNDAPVITSKTQSASIHESASSGAPAIAGTHTAKGAVTFHDVDILDTHTATVKPLGSGYIGSLAIGAVNQTKDSIPWTFKISDSLLDPLGPKDTLVQKYLVTVNDGHGGHASQVVTITLHGADHGVTITDLTPFAQGGDVTVDEDDLPNGTDTTKESLTAVGTFKISAPDGVDDLKVGGHDVIHNGVFTPVSFTTPNGSTLSFTAFNENTGVVTYSYKLNGQQDHLAPNVTALPESFTVSLTDTDGSSATAKLDVRIIDDAPLAVGGSDGGSVQETPLEGSAFLPTIATGNVASFFESGADVPLVFSLNSDAAAKKFLTDQGITAHGGHPLDYTFSGDTITAKDGATDIFTFRLEANGDWTFEILDTVDHDPFPNNATDVEFGKLIHAVDHDLDPADSLGIVTINIYDFFFPA